MTCVCGVAEGGRVVLGGDSAYVTGDGDRDLVRPKVFERDGILIGSSGEPRTRQLLKHVFELPPIGDDQDPEEYVIRDLCGALGRFLKEEGEYLLPKSDEQGGGWTLLIGVRGRLFKVSSWLGVVESITGYDAIGSGDMLALGSFASTEGMPARQRVELALRAAERHQGSVSAPFSIVER